MKNGGSKRRVPRDQLRQGLALGVLAILSALAIAGPNGLLAWSENEKLLDQRQAQVAQLVQERDALKNKVERLHPDGADPDLVGELLRRNLNVVHPDEVVITLEEEPLPPQ